VLQRLLTPEQVPDEVIRAAFAALAMYPTKNQHGRLMFRGKFVQSWRIGCGGSISIHSRCTRR